MRSRAIGVIGAGFILLATQICARADELSAAPCTSPPRTLRPVPGTHLIAPYPVLSQRIGEQGATLLDVLVGKDGIPSSVTVARSSGSPRLDEAAVSAVKLAWRWQPSNKDCANGVATKVQMYWNLHDAANPYSSVLILRAEDADYPADALAKGEEGLTVMTVALKDNGVVQETRLIGSSGFSDLDTKAMAIVLKHKFQPGEVDGKPVQSVLTVGMAFLRKNSQPTAGATPGN